MSQHGKTTPFSSLIIIIIIIIMMIMMMMTTTMTMMIVTKLFFYAGIEVELEKHSHSEGHQLSHVKDLV